MAFIVPDSVPLDWRVERESIDLAAVMRRELGEPPGRPGGEWWRCPFHDDRNPSMTIRKDRRGWVCYGCDARGDAVDLVMRLRSVRFPEAREILTGRPRPGRGARLVWPLPSRPAAAPIRRPDPAPPRRDRLTPEAAAALVESAAPRLFAPEGADALAYLSGRGLAPETIRAGRLGWLGPGNPDVPWRAPGVVIPWHDRGRLAGVKIRPPDAWRAAIPPDRRRPPKYLEIHRNPDRPPRLYPDPDVIRRGIPAIIVEGELDALLLAQELGELAAVVTLGAASGGRTRDGIDPDILACLGLAPRWYIATDADDAGDKAAALWEAYPRAKRFRPPAGAKDWTELHEGGANRIRYYWLPSLGWRGPTWDVLAAQRWGPGLDGDTPGIVRDRPADALTDEQRQAAAREPDALIERDAIQGESNPS